MRKRSFVAAGLALALPFGLAACGGGEKPTKAEVIDGMETMMLEQFEAMGIGKADFDSLGVTDEDWDTFYNCVVDGVYDEVSDDSLRAMASGDSEAKVSNDDLTTFTNQVNECQTSLLGN